MIFFKIDSFYGVFFSKLPMSFTSIENTDTNKYMYSILVVHHNCEMPISGCWKLKVYLAQQYLFYSEETVWVWTTGSVYFSSLLLFLNYAFDFHV